MPDPAYDVPYLPEPAAEPVAVAPAPHIYDQVPELGGGGGGALGSHYASPAEMGSHYEPYNPAGVDLSSLMNAHPAAIDASPPAAPPVAAGPNIHDPFGRGAGPLLAKSLLPEYRGEERGAQAEHMPTNIGGISSPFTAYDSAPGQHAASIENGRLMRNGAAADSSASTPMWKKDKADRLNFAMDTHGEMNLSDPKAEFIAGRTAARAAGATETGRINHSTMVAGGDVAGAGTVRMRDGKVETLGDGSGHYQPTITHTAQVAEQLAGSGVMDPARSSIELTGKGAGQKELTLSTQELLSYGGDFAAAKQSFAASGDAGALTAPEAAIRARHAVKDGALADIRDRGTAAGEGGSTAMLAQLRAERDARSPAAAGGGAAGAVADHHYDYVPEAGAAHHYDVVPEAGGGAAAAHVYDPPVYADAGAHHYDAAASHYEAPRYDPAPALPPRVAGEPAPEPGAAHLSNLTSHYTQYHPFEPEKKPPAYAPSLQGE